MGGSVLITVCLPACLFVDLITQKDTDEYSRSLENSYVNVNVNRDFSVAQIVKLLQSTKARTVRTRNIGQCPT